MQETYMQVFDLRGKVILCSEIHFDINGNAHLIKDGVYIDAIKIVDINKILQH